MNRLFDRKQVRRAYSRAAAGYARVDGLQREIESRLLESLDYLDDRQPQVVLDVGCGPGHAAAAMHKRWPKAQVVALDLSLPMLLQSRQRVSWWQRGLGKDFARVCADAAALPLAEGSVDVLFANLCLQWVEDLGAVFAGFRRVLRPGGLLLCSTFGRETLVELNAAFAAADDLPHVSPFIDIAGLGDALVAAGFRDPVLDRDTFHRHQPDLRSLMHELRALGETNALHARRRTLTGRARLDAAARAYEAMREAQGLPVTWEAIYAQAWAPEAGAPIRMGGHDVASVPLSAIPIRRRQPGR